MKHLLDFYRVRFVIAFATQVQYRVSSAIWLLATALRPLISIAVWSAVVQAQGGNVGGYNTSVLAGYFMIAMLVDYVTHTWVYEQFEWRVREGYFSPLLLRPIHPIHDDVAQNITYKILMLIVVIPVTILLLIVFHPLLRLSLLAGLAFGLALLQAFVLRFLVEWALGLLTFWTTRMNVLSQLYFVVLLFLSGQLVPFTLFPAPIQLVAKLLPFYWMVAFPVALCIQDLGQNEILSGLMLQSLWLLLSLLLLIVLWRRGIRRYSAVGA
jgi:ABC-2 type transport system permease protein